MDTQANQQQVESQITKLQDYLSTIQEHLEKVLTENKRLREVVRLAESELRKRRDRVQSLEDELQTLQTTDSEHTTYHESSHASS
ncbi:MAG: hypothetical protein Q9M10_03650 [Mariprofundaceae bacterium]|nr:hypothetical protein [Mariprofundaceae bacterium]MDQ7001276.1 hypothetical protein [Ghiorsea sp.]